MDVIPLVCQLIVNSTNLTQAQVLVGRENYNNVNFNNDLAVVDELITTPIGTLDKFDGDNEQLSYKTKYRSQLTIDWYGTNSQVNGDTFIARLRSQSTIEYARDNNIEILLHKNLSNIKNLQGKTYYPRFQLEIVVKYTDVITDGVLRIDTVNVEVNTNNEKQYNISIN